jgi:hypothetical protein
MVNLLFLVKMIDKNKNLIDNNCDYQKDKKSVHTTKNER